MKDLAWLIGISPWIIIIAGFNSVYVQRVIGTFLLARAEAIDAKREKMKLALYDQRYKVGLQK